MHPEGHRRAWLALAAVMLGSVMGPLDASIVNVALPAMAESLQVDMPTAQWIPSIYLLTISSLLLLFGRIGDMLGYRRTFLMGLASFIAASALCGSSPNAGLLIFFRAAQGIAAAMMTSMPYAIISASFPSGQRGRALGIYAISVACGLAMGPSLGGLVTDAMGWRFAFFINIPIGLAALLAAWWLVPEDKGGPGGLDLAGATAAFIALLAFLLLVNRFQGWGPIPLALLLISAASSLAFVLIERRAPHPLIDLSLFKNETFLFANLSAMLNFMSQYVMVFLTPFYLRRVLHLSPGNIGLVMTAFPLAVLCIAPFSGAISDRAGTRGLACAGAAICALALLSMAQAGGSAGALDISLMLALFGLGTGVFQSPNNSAVMGSAPRRCLGVASGILSTMRSVGMVLGIAVGGAVLYGSVPPEILQKPYLGGAEAQAFLSGLRRSYMAGAALTGTAAMTSLIQRKGDR